MSHKGNIDKTVKDISIIDQILCNRGTIFLKVSNKISCFLCVYVSVHVFAGAHVCGGTATHAYIGQKIPLCNTLAMTFSETRSYCARTHLLD